MINNNTIDDEISDFSEKSGIFSKKEWRSLGKNFHQFFKFIGEILAEKPEAESYPIYFLPSLLTLLVFCIMLGIGAYCTMSSFQTSIKITLSVLIPPVFLVGLIGGLWTATFFFQGTNSLQDLLIAGAIFCVPLSVGLFLFWLLVYATLLFAIPFLFFAHSTSLIALYIALPKILLLKGFSRFSAIILSIGFGVFSVLILIRLVV